MAWISILIWVVCLGSSLFALWQAYSFFRGMMSADEGTPRMIEIAGYVREGANAYLRQQNQMVALIFFLIALLLGLMSFVFGVQSTWVPFAFLSGGFFSGLAGWCGMKTATWASSRTAAGAQQSLNQGLQVAFRSGAVMGLTVVGLGLLDITLWYGLLKWVYQVPLADISVTMLSFGMGASTQALFARVGGGIFTKAADVGADLVGKIEQGIPEDDPRNPATIADNVGDNVGDVAGMGADLYESYCGSILAAAALGVAAFASPALCPEGMSVLECQERALLLPMAISAVGILFSIVGIFLVKTEENASQGALLKALARGIDRATGLVIVASLIVTSLLMPHAPGTNFFGFLPGVTFSIIVGLGAGWLIGKWTEYCTSDEYSPTKLLAAQAETGPATLIIGGIADGMMSVWAPVVVISAGTILAFGVACGWKMSDPAYFSLGLYGVGIAAVGMLSTLGITLATDAYGPIADNAGGNAEMAKLDPIVRQRTDALDSLGNTTAATGKGFAIGSAALTGLALLAAYVESVRFSFENWGNQVCQTQVQDDGLYKLSPGFVVQKHGDHNHMYLVMPRTRRDAAIAPVWDQVPTVRYALAHQGTAAGAKIPATLFAESTEHGEVKFLNGNPLISLRAASLPDFTDYYEASVMNPKVLVGIFLGGMSTFIFCALTMKAVGRAAKGMVEEVRRQFRDRKGIMEGTESPDYASPVAISTRAAQREMIIPSLLGLAMPVVTGLILGVAGVLGLLVGTLTSGFCVAVFMANAGGSWDNAKKHIEAGNFGGKGSEAHKAGVVGDTVGDPFKDTSGPSLNILIKLMSMVSVVAAGVVVKFSLVALGLF